MESNIKLNLSDSIYNLIPREYNLYNPWDYTTFGGNCPLCNNESDYGVDNFDTSGTFHIAKTVSVPADATLVLLDTPIYLTFSVSFRFINDFHCSILLFFPCGE